MSSPSTEPWREPTEYEKEEKIADDLESYQTIRHLQQLESKFIRVSRAAYIIEECRKIIEEACKKNPKGLPW